ncbi:hypothetical protein AOLI_G00243270 [Acnodon oligacanthus]
MKTKPGNPGAAAALKERVDRRVADGAAVVVSERCKDRAAVFTARPPHGCRGQSVRTALRTATVARVAGVGEGERVSRCYAV